MTEIQFSRRRFIAQGAALALAGYLQAARSETSATQTTVRTDDGPLIGEVSNGVRVFRGIPFAQPPLGSLRFQPPRVVKPWKTPREALRFAPAAMQPGEPTLEKSEDCLYLNIWAPEDKGPHPVFVWIHGGGFTGGHAFAPIFDGAEFAREGIVVVTVAYRLGVFGFLDLEPLLGKDFRGSANNALRDLIEALRWVKRNIASFGGDPNRVTVGGESAGAKLTDILMGTPEAAPLLHQMISESGGAERVWSKEIAAAVSKGFGKLWTSEQAEQPTALATDPAASLIRVQERFTATWPQHFPLRCELDGLLLPRLPIETINQGCTRGKRLLIGTNRDESALFVGPHPAHDATAADLGNMPEAKFAEVFRQYEAVYPNMSVEQRRIAALTAEEYWVPSIRVADAHVYGGGSAWMYRLDFAPSSGRFNGEAYHSLDLGMVWDKPAKDIANADNEAALGRQMHAAWTSFIRGEAPTAPGLPRWPQYTPAARATLIFDTTSRVVNAPADAELRLWKGVL